MACVVRGCKSHKSRKKTNDTYVSFHCFPNDENFKVKWIKLVRPNWIPTKYSRICSIHFSPDSFYATTEDQKWRRLKENAIPSLYLSVKDIETLADNTFEGQNTSNIDAIKEEISEEETGYSISTTTPHPHSLLRVYGPEVLANIRTQENSPPKKQFIRSRNFCDEYDDSLDLIERNCLMKELAEQKKRIVALEKKLLKAKTINKRHLRKINTLTKRVTRSEKRKSELHDVINRLIAESE